MVSANAHTQVAGTGVPSSQPAIASLLILVTPLASVAVSRVAVVVAIVALAYVVIARFGELRAILRDALGLARRPAMTLVLVLFVVALASSLWALYPAYAWTRAGLALLMLPPLMVIAAAAWRERPDGRMAWFALIGMGGAALATILAAPAYLMVGDLIDYPLKAWHFNRAAVTLVLLAPAALLACWHRPRVAAALFALIAAACMVSHSESAKFGLLVMAALFVVAMVQARAARILVVAIILAATLLLPLTIFVLKVTLGPVIAELLPAANAAERLEIWEQFMALVPVKPLFGWGMESGRFLFHEGVWQLPANLQVADFPPIHSHNIFLQMWFELGVLGALLSTGILLTAYMMVRDLPRVPRAFAFALLAGYIAVGSVSYGAWQHWWIALAGIAVITFGHAVRDHQAAQPS